MINEEKSISKSQQRLFGMVQSYKNGNLKLDKLPQSLADKIKGIADGERRKTGDKRKFTKGMSKGDVKDFASTKHEGLPQKVEENKTIKMENKIKKFGDFINESNEEQSNEEQLNESGLGEFGIVNIHVDGEGWIKNKVASTISSVVKNLQGECHIFVDGVEINRY